MLGSSIQSMLFAKIFSGCKWFFQSLPLPAAPFLKLLRISNQLQFCIWNSKQVSQSVPLLYKFRNHCGHHIHANCKWKKQQYFTHLCFKENNGHCFQVLYSWLFTTSRLTYHHSHQQNSTSKRQLLHRANHS